MMTFDDAKECTFTPFVNGERKKTFSIKGWIDGLGENFKLRFPMIFKFGMFRRAHIIKNKRDYRSSYKTILDNFNIYHIK